MCMRVIGSTKERMKHLTLNVIHVPQKYLGKSTSWSSHKALRLLMFSSLVVCFLINHMNKMVKKLKNVTFRMETKWTSFPCVISSSN